MATPFEFVVPPSCAGQRLDKYLAEQGVVSRSAVERLLCDNQILVVGGKADKKYLLRGGEKITLTLPEVTPCEAIPQNIPLDIVYEDEDIAVINKPQGLVVHPAPGNPDGTLVNALLYHCGNSLSGVGGVIRPGIVHRIDKDTSGLLVIAKNDEAHHALSEQLKTHTVSRTYEAIVLGNIKEDSGTIHLAIDRHPVDRKRMAVCRGVGQGRDAITHFEVVKRFSQFTHVRCHLETGRTHQIRVHMASFGHPLLGDPLYGGDGTRFQAHHSALFHGQCLHAGRLSFIHPRTGETVVFHAPLPADFATVLSLLEKEFL